jgi:16S rRNA processing protein RimM
LEKEIAKKKNQKIELDEETLEAMKKEKRERNKILFPDNKTIDPYDPSTYGYTELGTILGPHGVHGLLKISAVTEFSERLCAPGIRHLKAPNRRSPREIVLLEGRHRLKNEYLIKFEGISNRNEALKLRGSALYARQEERPQDIGEDEFLVTELVGLDVYLVTGYGEDDTELETDYETDDDNELEQNQSQDDGQINIGGKFVGTVQGVVLAEEMCSTPGLGQDLLEVVLPRGRNGIPSWKDEMVLIPLVPSIVPTVDIERRIIYIDPPGGLLDLTYVKEEYKRIKGFLPETSSYEKNKHK